VGAEQADEFIADDLDDLLRGAEGIENFLALRLFADALDEFLDDLEVDVGFEQSDTDLLQGRIHIGLGEFAFSAQVFEDALELVA